MASFFAILALAATGLISAAMWLGFQGDPNHLFWALAGVTAGLSAHCLIFGIFTGAGKDTRELVQDLGLNPEFTSQTKSFRKIAFPPALYCTFLIVLTAIMGGALSTSIHGWVRWVHQGLAWVTLIYNLKTFWLEWNCIRQNAAILRTVNQAAAVVTTEKPELKAPETFDSPEVVDGLGGYEWGQHVFALGKFLCFLGLNAWLPYIYMRFIMAKEWVEAWPFLLFSAVFLLSGYFLRFRYRDFSPRLTKTPA